jgi:molecular chaperone DnaJ
MTKDYYASLGVEKNATVDEINAAYRKLALQYHPDRNVDNKEESTEKFKEVAEAYEVLNNPDKRRQYDNPGMNRGMGGFGGGVRINPFDMFNSFFGQRQHRGIDLSLPIDLSFDESVVGVSKDVIVKIHERCNVCSGTGTKTWKPCILCGGSGRKVIQQSAFVVQVMCETCEGSGKLSDVKCEKCENGISGLKEETVAVKVPAGAFSGLRIKASGRGDEDNNGVRGDLYLEIRVSNHPLFIRHELDIICEVPVPYSIMVLGGNINVPTLQSTANVKIKSGSKDGTKLKLSGLGMRNVSNPDNVGDMYVVLKIDIPVFLSQEYEEQLVKITELEKQHVSPKIKEFEKYVKV